MRAKAQAAYRRSALAAAALGAGCLAAAPAQAGYLYDLSIGPGVTGTGSIEFATLSGNSVADVIDFAFHVASGTGSPQDYDEGDIASITWSIDAAFNLSLLLQTSLVPFGGDQSALTLTNQAGFHPGLCAPIFSFLGTASCVLDAAGSGVTTVNQVLTATYRGFNGPTDVPEPAALALLGLGLAALATMRRRA